MPEYSGVHRPSTQQFNASAREKEANSVERDVEIAFAGGGVGSHHEDGWDGMGWDGFKLALFGLRWSRQFRQPATACGSVWRNRDHPLSGRGHEAVEVALTPGRRRGTLAISREARRWRVGFVPFGMPLEREPFKPDASE